MEQEIEIKETQGQKKVRQYIDDLLRNKYFVKKIKKILWPTGRSDGEYKNILRLIDKYKKLDKETAEYLKKELDWDKEKEFTKIAEEYGLDSELLRPVFITYSSLKEGELKESFLYDPLQTDLCFLVDNYDENLNPAYPPMPLAIDTRKQNHLKVFPVSIDIHRFATKRDVLDYIEKKWFWIEDLLSSYKDYKKIKFRKRKHNRKLLDFIWENRKLKVKDLKDLLNKNFPNNGLVHYELHKIISIEKQRRNKKITVGQ